MSALAKKNEIDNKIIVDVIYRYRYTKTIITTEFGKLVQTYETCHDCHNLDWCITNDKDEYICKECFNKR